MKSIFYLLPVVTGVLLSGCASGRNGMALETVGPQPPQSAVISPANGTLVVYSAYEAGAEFNSRNEFGQSHSDYRLLSGDGKLLQKVHNDTGTMLQNPAAVQLPPGKYQVLAQANGYGCVTVPVIIEPQQTTIIHLEGGYAWPDEGAFNQTNAVRLPDGLVVGWKAGS
ncbi:MAG: hypothetical protein P4N60_20905 [Verrucomicrobiae bacterium]|nr:hypothetical protein [Verrucomicrobiae bacterium]